MGASSLKQQTNALLRKNLVYQKRRSWVNCCVILLPLLFVGLLAALQGLIDNITDQRDNKCGCMCIRCCSDEVVEGQDGKIKNCRVATSDSQCTPDEDCEDYNDDICGLRYSDPEQALFCEDAHPASWPVVFTIATAALRAFPWNPQAVMFFTGNDMSIASSIADNMLPPFVPPASIPSAENNKFLQMAEDQGTFRGEFVTQTGLTIGTDEETVLTLRIEPAFTGQGDTSILTQDCRSIPLDFIDSLDVNSIIRDAVLSTIPSLAESEGEFGLNCTDVSFHPSTVENINRHLFCGFEKARCNASEELNETVLPGRRLLDDNDVVSGYNNAFDFKDSDSDELNVDIWYNNKDTISGNDDVGDYFRISPAQNLAADAWVKWNLNNNSDDNYSSKMLAVVEMPKPFTKLRLEFSSFLSVLLFTWVIQLFLPIMLVQLVDEKENRLRIMMKMHGLGDAAYWIVNYLYYLVLYILYIAVFIAIGSAVDLGIFRLTDYSIQIVFYFLFGNLQIAFAFMLSSLFRSSMTAMVFSFLWVFGTGLLGQLLLVLLMERNVFYVKFLELIPAFGAYRVYYEMAEYSFRAAFRNSEGLTWSTLSDAKNDVDIMFLIFIIEWPLFLAVAWYLEQVVSSGTGVNRHPLYFLDAFRRKSSKMRPQFQSMKRGKEVEMNETVLPDTHRSDSHVDIYDESQDVLAERKKVEDIPPQGDEEHSIVIRHLRKVFPGFAGTPTKVAVHDLQLAVRRGEVFGLLGPNGAGKTTSINMLVGFLEPTAGSALIEGLDITEDMNKIYDLMGVCPQHNLVWGTLSGAEHLYFYGRLKGLEGNALKQAVEDALKSVHLFAAGVGDKLVKHYSGGMKRRLSVAISLIGNPKVVYLDEPSTGLDPASRRNLWDVVKNAREDKAIILTTHSMKEAEVLCDRLGIFVNGQLMVIGNPKELTSRYGEYLVFTLITRPEDVEEAKKLVKQFSAASKNTYELGGTLIYELPTRDVNASDVFNFMESAKSSIQVLDWGVANATLEEVFIRIATTAGANTDVLQ